MAEIIFNAGISGRNVVAAPHASHGGTNNFYLGSDGPSKPRKPFSTVPFRPDPDFVERPSIMAWLREKCSQPASRAALVGLGGIGKSQLAVHYAHEVRQGSPNTFIFWVHTSTQARFEEAYRSIAERLQLPRRSDPDVNVMQLVYDWLCTEENGQWLMVLDNADNADVLYPTSNRNQDHSVPSTAQLPLASFLPQSSNGAILITSRSNDVAERLTGSSWSVLPIQAMNAHQAQQLLQNKLQERHDEAVAPDLLQALEYMPLAITQAAAYILQRGPRMSPSLYLDEFRKSEKKRAGLLNRNMGDLRRDPSASNSIFTTWQMTFDKIRQERQSAADLLVFMSFFDPQGIPEWVVRSYRRSERGEVDADVKDNIQNSQNDGNSNSEDDSKDGSEDSVEDDFEDDLDMLRLSSLVAVTTQDGVLKMHALVQFCTRAWLSSFDDAQKWRRRFLQILSKEYPTTTFEKTYENWPKCRELEPHVELILTRKPKEEKDAEDLARLLINSGCYKQEMGLYEVANARLTEAIKIRRRLLGTEHANTLSTTSILASTLYFQGKYEEAEQIAREVLDGYEKLCGSKEHLPLLPVANSLALALQQQGKYKEAEQMFQESLDSCEKFLGKENPSTLISLINIVIVLQYQGKYEKAEQTNRQALDSCKKVFGTDHPTTITSIGNLAAILHYRGKYEEAEQINRLALNSCENAFGKEHPYTIRNLSNLASALQYQGKYEEAEQIYRQAIDSYKKVLGEEHPNILESISTLASVLKRQAKYEEAEQINRQALNSCKKVFGEDHRTTIISISNLAVILLEQGKYAEAEQMNRLALNSWEKTLGKEHPDAITTLSNLGNALHYQKKHAEAEQIYRQAIDSYKKVLGEKHPDTLKSVTSLALALQSQAKLEEAEQISQQGLDIQKKVLGELHPDTLTSMNNYAVLLQHQGRYKETEKMKRKTLGAYTKTMGEEHPRTLTSIHNLAYLLEEQRRFEEANELYDRAWTGYMKALGPDHPETIVCRDHRSSLKRQMGLE